MAIYQLRDGSDSYLSVEHQIGLLASWNIRVEYALRNDDANRDNSVYDE